LILYYAVDHITGKGITESVIFSIKSSLQGAGLSQFSDLIIRCLILIIITIFFSIVLYLIKKKNNSPTKYTNKRFIYLSFILIFFSIFLSPIVNTISQIILVRDKPLDKNSEFYNYYQFPQIKNIGTTKNLVFIYAESLERTYFDEKLFPGLINNLRKLENESISFTNIGQDSYSENSIAGLVAGQCGIPLVSPSSLYGMDKFLGSAVCLSDLLHNEKYFLSYYSGVYLNFSDTNKFFITHNLDEIKGRSEFVDENSSKYNTDWSLYDDTLFDLAFNRILELSQKTQKFAFIIPTMDTHHPSGYMSFDCINNNIYYGNGLNSMLNSVACSDYLISKFVKKIRESKFGNNIVIVIASDHLALPNTAIEILEKGDRKNLFIINSPDVKKGEEISIPRLTLDIGSTILPFIGYSGNIGLGRDLMDVNNSSGGKVANNERVTKYLRDIKSWVYEIMAFWNFPKIENEIKISLLQNSVSIDDRILQLPILIELNDLLETNLTFDLNSPLEMNLLRHFGNLKTDTPFLMINKCITISDLINKRIDSSGVCLLFGRKDVGQNYREIKVDTLFTKEDIIKMVGL
jgi:phosphoglycerol transferase